MRALLPVLLSLALALSAQAQRAGVAGTVAAADTAEPVAGATVMLTADGATRGTASDVDGAFLIDGLLPGTYALEARAVGFEALRDTLALAFGERRALALRLRPAQRELATVEVEAEGPTPTAAPVGLVRLGPRDLLAIPAPDLSGDLAAVLTVQPGVVTVGDRGGQLYIRGGTPTQNLVLVDGMRVYQPFHIVGFYSAFPADIVQRADVYAGGFGARYGGRISSVIDVEARAGNKQRVAGSASVAPFLSGVRVEGPLVPGRVSALASLRASTVEHVAEPLFGEPLPYRFADGFGKVHAWLDGRGSFLALTGLFTQDRGTVSGSAGDSTVTRWHNEALGARFFYLPPHFAAALDLSLHYSGYASRFDVTGQTPGGVAVLDRRRADVRSFGGAFGLAYFLQRHTLRFGFEAQTLRFATALTGLTQPEESLTEGAFFVEAQLGLGPVQVEPGLRLQTFPSQSRTASLEPRLRVAWRAGRHTLSAAGGLYRQELLGLEDQRDLGDVFTAWAPVPAGRPLPTALHGLVGWSVRPTARLDVGVEAYAKRLQDLVLFVGGAPLAPGAGLLRGYGDVFGLDARAEWRSPRLYLLGTYGLGSTRYTDLRGTYRPPHDRRHRLALVARAERGPWALGVRFQAASGRPFTRVVGFYDALPPDAPLDTPGVSTPVFEAAPYAGLGPAYHRLDVSLERGFRFDRVTLTALAGVINAYDQDNLFYFDAYRGNRVDQLPLIPTFGLRLDVE